jgi:biotin-(acetyl-CoA carboxylase) ligase
MKPFAQTHTETAGKVRLERMWMKQDGKLVCAFVKVPDNSPNARP